jgi:hypothetical protein
VVVAALGKHLWHPLLPRFPNLAEFAFAFDVSIAAELVSPSGSIAKSTTASAWAASHLPFCMTCPLDPVEPCGFEHVFVCNSFV